MVHQTGARLAQQLHSENRSNNKKKSIATDVTAARAGLARYLPAQKNDRKSGRDQQIT